MKTLEIISLDIEYEGDPSCPEAVSSVDYKHHPILGDHNYASFEFELDRPDQLGVSGRIIAGYEDYDYETAVELHRYVGKQELLFTGVLVNDTIFVREEDIRFGERESHSYCVRDHQAEMEAAWETEQLAA